MPTNSDEGSISVDELMAEMGEPPNWRDELKDQSIVARLYRTRKAMGYSMNKVAELAGLPVQRINDFEKKRRRPSMDQLYKWSDALEMDTPAILLGYLMETLEAANLDTGELQARMNLGSQ